jgi:hypothetical protein
MTRRTLVSVNGVLSAARPSNVRLCRLSHLPNQRRPGRLWFSRPRAQAGLAGTAAIDCNIAGEDVSLTVNGTSNIAA